MTDPALLEKTDAMLSWYWQFGAQRKDAYALNGPWLDRLYQTQQQAEAVTLAAQDGKACMAVWGPSQTGKSTLLSAYFDSDDVDDLGNNSPLQWSLEEPVRFVVGNDKSEKVIVLNPFNLGSDASGCVTRFSLEDQVPDPTHPVEILLATESQVMQALAVGYLSECKVSNAKGEATSFDADSFRNLLERQKVAGPPSREAYEAAHELANVIELLILSELEQPRYKNLETAWEKSLRRQLLESPALLSSVEAVQAFACELLWDNWPSLTEIFRQLAAKRRQLRGLFGEQPVRCSFRVAALLLDIGAYKKCAESPAVRQQVLQIFYAADETQAAIGQDGSGGKLVDSVEDFGLFQSLIWQLTVPVRRDLLQTQAPVLCNFMEAADLLDFPGVANAFTSADRLTNDTLATDRVKLLTEVLKRGKTASVVVTSARNLDIDSFSILTRVGKFPSQPVQLVAGLRSWLKAYGEEFPPKTKRLPINLVLTFASTLVNQVISTGIKQGLYPSFDQLKGLGPLSQPQVVTTFATNYPQFFEARFDGTPEQQRQALDLIEGDKAFRDQFADNAESFEAMAADGGRDYLFGHLTRQALGSQRPHLLAERWEKLGKALEQLKQEALPVAGDTSGRRSRELEEWIGALNNLVDTRWREYPQEDAAAYLSRRLRALLNVDPDKLDPLPLKALPNKIPMRSYIEKQFHNWQADKTKLPEITEMGLQDSAHAMRMLGYLVEATDLNAVETLMKDDFGYLNARSDGLQSRRFLAAKMSKELLRLHGEQRPASTGPSLPRPMAAKSVATTESHRGVEDVKKSLFEMATKEDAQDFTPSGSPHYLSVIAPLLRRLEQVKGASAGKRPPQPGDAEFAAIFAEPVTT